MADRSAGAQGFYGLIALIIVSCLVIAVFVLALS